MTIVGPVLILGVLVSYLAMIFVLHRFTYKTWIFDLIVGTGMVIGASGWLLEGGSWLSWSTIALGSAWFLVSRGELRIRGSREFNLRVGDKVPAMAFLKVDGTRVSEQDLIAHAPALLALYRGWWCPSSRVQLNTIMAQYADLNTRGVRLYAASVDEPKAATPLQDYVGDSVTILCGVSDEMLTTIGVRDKRGAPWYDRIIFRAPERPIAMPAALLIGKDGTILFASRSTRVDEGPRLDGIRAALSHRQKGVREHFDDRA